MKFGAKLRHYYIPIAVALIAFVTTVISVMKSRFDDSQAFTLTQWDYSALAGAFFSLLMLLITAIMDYREKQAAARKKIIRLTLRRMKLQPSTLNTWNEDERFASGALSLSLMTSEGLLPLCDYVFRYGELTAPEAPAERILERIVTFPDTDIIKNASGFLLSFEPFNDDAKIRCGALYDTDDVRDALFDAKELHPGTPQTLIYTEGLESMVPQYLAVFSDPDNVLRTCTNHRPYNENALPTLFNVVREIKVEIADEISVSTKVLRGLLSYEFAIAAHFGNNSMRRRLLHFAVLLKVPLDPESVRIEHERELRQEFGAIAQLLLSRGLLSQGDADKFVEGSVNHNLDLLNHNL